MIDIIKQLASIKNIDISPVSDEFEPKIEEAN